MLEYVRGLFRRIHSSNRTHFQIFCDKNLTCFLNASPAIPTLTPSRTTIIVKRIYEPRLYKEGNKPRMEKITHFYNFVEDTNNRPESLVDVVLTAYVQGFGNAGDVVSIKMSEAYNKLLIPGLAEYATPEMIAYSNKLKADQALQGNQLSVSVERTVRYLQAQRLSVVMNQFNEWTIEPWHIRASARKAGIHILSDDSIELPSKPIKGPDMALEEKEFFVTLTINKKAKVKVRCVIHHWTAKELERLPYKPEYWKEPAGMVFPEDEQTKSPPTNPP